MNLQNCWRNERGQALVETALIFSFLLILIIGIVDGGLILQRQIAVVNAAREGARFGAFGAKSEDIYTNTVIAASKNLLDTDELTIVVIQVSLIGDARTPTIVGWDVYPADGSTIHVARGDILEAMYVDSDIAGFNNIEMVIVDVVYEHKPIFWGTVPIGSWTVMRTHG